MAKKEHYYTRFENDGIYHVYNRTVDRKPMFTSNENYAFFIRQFDKYLSDYVKIYAYNLLGNHFHFMIKVNNLTDLTSFEKLSNLKTEKLSNQQKTTHDIVSHQFRKFFKVMQWLLTKSKTELEPFFKPHLNALE